MLWFLSPRQIGGAKLIPPPFFFGMTLFSSTKYEIIATFTHLHFMQILYKKLYTWQMFWRIKVYVIRWEKDCRETWLALSISTGKHHNRGELFIICTSLQKIIFELVNKYLRIKLSGNTKTLCVYSSWFSACKCNGKRSSWFHSS